MKLYTNTYVQNSLVRGREVFLRVFSLMLDFVFSFFVLRDEDDVGFMVTLHFSKRANLDAYATLVIQFWRLHLTASIGPMDLSRSTQLFRILHHDHDVSFSNFGAWNSQGVFVFESCKAVSPVYVHVLGKDMCDADWLSLDILGKTNSLDNSSKLCGWRQCHKHEIAKLEYEASDVEVITKEGKESYDPYLYVRGRDFKKYFLS